MKIIEFQHEVLKAITDFALLPRNCGQITRVLIFTCCEVFE